jgi:hypothetical protein
MESTKVESNDEPKSKLCPPFKKIFPVSSTAVDDPMDDRSSYFP